MEVGKGKNHRGIFLSWSFKRDRCVDVTRLPKYTIPCSRDLAPFDYLNT